jgi:hypothetical protein
VSSWALERGSIERRRCDLYNEVALWLITEGARAAHDEPMAECNTYGGGGVNA